MITQLGMISEGVPPTMNTKFFTNQFTVVRPVRRVNVDLTQGMLRELDERAARLNVSRQAVIKTLLRHALDQEQPTRTPEGGRGI